MRTLIFTLTILGICNLTSAQSDSIQQKDSNTYKILLNDGNQLVGHIIKQDIREIHFLTLEKREMIIPQYTIKTIEVVKSSDFNLTGQYVGEDKFATRYFITTNGLPIKKGENYVQWNLFGPDFQFAIADDLGVGIMTSWIGMPMIGSIKKSWKINDQAQFALGALAGTGSWAAPDVHGVLPFGTVSFGNRSKNIAFSGGYGAIWDYGDVEGRAMTSVAGMLKISRNVSLVFDSFIVLPGKTTEETYETYYGEIETYKNERPGFALLIPGVRWHMEEGKAFQFGFSGLLIDGWLAPVPIPTVQWYRSL